MAKISKIYLSLGGYGEKYLPSLKGADESDLSILAGLFLLADQNGEVELSRLEAALGLDGADIAASVKYWKGAEVVLSSPVRQAEEEKTYNVTTAHKDGVITHSGVEKYSNEELEKLIESRYKNGFIDAAQQAIGKMFNTNEINKLVGIVDQLGFEEGAVLAILEYCRRKGKPSLSYAEKMAVTFHDEDILTEEAAHAQIEYLEKRDTDIEKIRSLYGFGGRALSPTEKKYFTAWTETYGFSFEIIEKAYNITVDTIQTPVPKYTNTILKNWYELGLKTVSEIDGYIEEQDKEKSSRPVRTGKKAAVAESDSDAEEWLEQLLKNKF